MHAAGDVPGARLAISLKIVRDHSLDRIYIADPDSGTVTCYSIPDDKVLWVSNPDKDWTAKEGEYRFSNPKLIEMRLISGSVPCLFVKFSNSRFGCVDLNTGQSKCDGRD